MSKWQGQRSYEEEVIQPSMEPKALPGSSSSGSRVLVAMGSVKDRQSDDSLGTTQGGLSTVVVVGNRVVASRDCVKIFVLMCDETVSLVGWQTMLLVYAAGQIGDKRADERDLTGRATAGAAALYLLKMSKEQCGE